MPSFREAFSRVSQAIRILRQGQVIAATVRAGDVAGRGYTNRGDAAQAMDRYRKWVAVACRRNSGGVAATPLRVYRKAKSKPGLKTKRLHAHEHARLAAKAGQQARGIAGAAGDVEEIIDPNYPLVKLLAEANPLINGYTMKYQIETVTSMAGNFFLFKVYGKGSSLPTELWPGFPQFVRVLPSDSGLIGGYAYGRGMEREIYLEPEAVVRFAKPNPFGDPFVGLPDVFACLDEADLSTAFTRFAVALVDRGVNPSLIIKLKSADENTRLQVEAAVRAKYQGYEKAGEPLVFSNAADGNLEVDTVNMAAHEVGYLAGQSEQAVKEVIAACFDIPVEMLTLSEKALASSKMLMPHFQTFSLVPRCMFQEEAFNQYLVPDFREVLGDETLFVAFDNPVDRDDVTQTDRAVKVYTSRICTLNEARAMIGGLDPVPDGDEIPPDPATMAADDENDPRQSDKDQKEEKVKGLVLKAMGELPERKETPKPGEPKPPKSFVRLLRGMYEKLRSGTKPRVDEMLAGDQIVGTITITLNATDAKAFVDEVADMFEEGAVATGKGVEIDVLAEAVRYAEDQSAQLVRNINDKVREQIRDAVAEGLGKQEARVDIARRIKETIDADFSPSRALLVAQTEATEAMNRGRLEAYRKSGVKAKRWVLSGNPCPLCIELAKRSPWPLDKPFAAKGETVYAGGKAYEMKYKDVLVPGPHPGCACTIVDADTPEGN